MKIDLEELERKARREATELDGLHGDPSKRGGWIGHRDHARNVVALIARIRELEAVASRAADVFEAIGASPGNEDLPTWARQIRELIEKGAVLT